MNLLNTVFPNLDFSSVGGFLQLLFIQFGIVLIGLAAVTLVAGWASDETSGRLEFLLATPLSRARWAGSGGIGILVDMALVVLLTAVGIAIGGLIAGGDLANPLAGSTVLVLLRGGADRHRPCRRWRVRDAPGGAGRCDRRARHVDGAAAWAAARACPTSSSSWR